MHRILPYILVFLYSIPSAFAQSDVASMSPVKIDKMGEWVPEWDIEGFDASIKTERQPHGKPYREEIQRYQDSIIKIKVAEANKLEHVISNESSNKTTVNFPSITKGFKTINTQGTPSDNTIAVNSTGQIVASVNSLIKFYSQSGQSLSGTISLSNFFSSPSNGTLLTNSVCDPKVLFDPESKRFIVMAQTCDGQSSTSQILIAFSKSENPQGGWYYYTFTGNPSSISQSVWFDYPKMGINSEDLFITGNFFTNSFSYSQSGIYQIDKSIGMSGGTYNTGDATLFSGISGNPFTLVPTNSVWPASLGAKMYFVCTYGSFQSSSNRLLLYELDGRVQTSPNLKRNDLFVASYSQPAPAVQKGSSTTLNVADFRGMDAIYSGGMIHFATQILGSNNYNQIMYDRITYNNSSNQWDVDEYAIGASNVDLAYPSIGHLGYDQWDQTVVILMDLASPAHYPSIGAIVIGNDKSSTGITVIKEGINPVSIFPSGGETRWGDYSTLCRDYSATTPTLWGFGMYGGNSSSSWENWATNFITNEPPTGVKEIRKEEETMTVFPNPVSDVWNLAFETETKGQFSAKLYDIKGSLVKDLYTQDLNKGKHNFAFNKGVLAPGTYMISMTLDGESIASKTLVVK